VFEVLMNQNLIFGLLGGLGLFLFGMKIMSEGLQKIAGDRLRRILAALTSNRIIGTLVGIAVTALIQSSSATTVMVVGFVNAGLMSLVQSIGVVLGANVGTTITAQIIAFKITQYALPAIGIGCGLKLFSRNRTWSYVGEIVLGFGILFYGMSVLQHAFDPVRESEEFRQMFAAVGDNHLLGVLLGALMTIIVQSSSATIVITLAAANSGLLTFEGSVALILGENIGTTITANLAAVGTNLAARRTAFAHFLFNVFGVAYMLLLFSLFIKFINQITPGNADFVIQTQEQAANFAATIGDKPFIARHIANTHTMFNIINTLIFLPLVGFLAKISTYVIRGKDEVMEHHLKYIDNRVLNTPPIALVQARSETRRMAQVAREMLEETLLFLKDLDRTRVAALEKKEALTDLLQKEITDFLVVLSQKSISQDSSRTIASMMHIVNDLERVGDHCENLWRLGSRRVDQKISFSEAANQELEDIGSKTRDFLKFVIEAMERSDKSIGEQAQLLEESIDQLEETLRNRHISRLNTGECAVIQGLVFIDMLHNFEKIGDHTFNIAAAVIGKK
jgi:phosphate:Na+ symporter